MKLRSFSAGASVVAFILGAVYVLNDQASITANVIGASGPDAGFTSIVGLIMIVASMGLFIVSMHSTDGHDLSLERLVRKGKEHHNLNTDPTLYDAKKEMYDDLKKETP